MRTYEQALEEFNNECQIIADQCEKEGYPAHGSNYDLRVESIMKDYPGIFDTE